MWTLALHFMYTNCMLGGRPLNLLVGMKAMNSRSLLTDRVPISDVNHPDCGGEEPIPKAVHDEHARWPHAAQSNEGEKDQISA